MTNARRPIIGGNWKMNTDLASAVELADDVIAGITGGLEETVDVVVFPPFPYLMPVGKTLGHHVVGLGAQDVYFESNGAFTGEVSVEMLTDLDVTWVLCGHSERRHVLGEGDELVNRKVRAALEGGLHVILCIGETIDQREADRTDEVNIGQLRAGLAGVDEDAMGRVVIAYEPVWAIGTGHTATPEDAQAAHEAIRGALAAEFGAGVADATRIQYGGSMKPSNAAALLGQPDIDGGLIGGASLSASDFVSIVASAAGAATGSAG